MKSDKEVNEQADEENQTQAGRAKKGTSNDKNYTSRCTALGLHKMFAALPEVEKGPLRTTCFIPLLLIDPITTMSTLVVEIFYRHLSDMKFQYGETIIQMKPIYVCLILGLGVSPITNEFLFVDPEHMTNFRMSLKFPRIEEFIHLFPKLQGWRMTSSKHRQIVTFEKFFTYPNLLVIAMKPSETDMEKNLVQQAMRHQIEAPAIGIALVISAPAVSTPVVSTPVVVALVIGSNSSATEIGAVVVRVFSQLEKHGKMLLKLDDHDDDVEVGREVNFNGISSEYGGDLLEWKKGDDKNNTDKKDVEEKVKSEEEEVQEMEESKNGDEKVDGDEKDNDTMVVAEVAKTDIVFFNQEEVIGEAYQASTDQTTAVSVEERTLEFEKTEDEASQEEDVGEANQTKESKEEVEQNKDEDEKSQVDHVWSLRKDGLSPEAKKNNCSTYMRIGEETVCLNALYTLYPDQWLENELSTTWSEIEHEKILNNEEEQSEVKSPCDLEIDEFKRNQGKFSPWGEWIPYCETDFEDEYFKVDDSMSQEDLEESLQNQPSMSPSIISFVNPINCFEETMTETKYFSLSSNDFSDDDDDGIKYEYMESSSRYTIICEELLDDDICTKVKKFEIVEPVADVINLLFPSQSPYGSPQPCLKLRPPDINYNVENQ
ncbi:hypothetical protein GIB67_042894 [Kingdonia uniflora]|uniref:Uncharacterized protein n=1 Tax=Kingdonia uniflora TaxID=39325 RepID=A0A7J7P2P3_9MAGN|nr:hypothetical protein GIB67_042894 [Kingdonia uniflora]